MGIDATSKQAMPDTRDQGDLDGLSSRELRRAYDRVAVGILIIDRAGVLLELNSAAAKVLAVVTDDDGVPNEPPQICVRVEGAPIADVIGSLPRGRWRTAQIRDAHGAVFDSRFTVCPDDTDLPPFAVVTIWQAARRGPDAAPERRRADGALRQRLSGLGLAHSEVEVAELLLQGHRVASIANELFLSTHTVRNRLKRIFAKLDVGSQVELVLLLRSLVDVG